MPVLKWNTPPAGTQEDRRAHVVGHGDGVSLVHAVSGDKVEGQGNTNTLGPNIEVATKWSTAPYRGEPVAEIEKEVPNPWGYRSVKRAKRCMANDDTCMAWATAKYDGQYCNAHGRQSQGLPAWPPNEKPETE